MLVRILLSGLFFLSIFFFPWFVTVLLGLLLVVRYPAYEVVLGGLMLDFLYGASVPSFHIGPYLFTIFFSATLVLSIYIKQKLVFYQ